MTCKGPPPGPVCSFLTRLVPHFSGLSAASMESSSFSLLPFSARCAISSSSASAAISFASAKASR